MNISNLYEMIFKRKSIRKYRENPLSDEKLSNIKNHIKQINPLFPDVKTEIKIVTSKDVRGLLQVKAPYYLVAFSEIKSGYLLNIGFMLQQIDLFLAASGLGSCWQGWLKPTRELRNDHNLEFITVMGLGAPMEKLYRNSPDEYKRKPIEHIRNVSDFDDFIEPARLAPFGGSQPYFFYVADNLIHVFCVNSGILKIEKLEKMNLINTGIAISHFWIAAEYFGKNFEFYSSRVVPVKQGFSYLGTIKIK